MSTYRKATQAEIEAAIAELATAGVRVDLLDANLLAMSPEERMKAWDPYPEPEDEAAWNEQQLQSLYAIQNLERYLNERGLTTTAGAGLWPKYQQRFGDVGVVWEAFNSLARYWKLSREQQAKILGTTRETLSKWDLNPQHRVLPDEALDCVLLMSQIYANLHSFYGDVSAADDWPHRSNQDFNGKSPLDRMLESREGLGEVEQYARQMVS